MNSCTTPDCRRVTTLYLCTQCIVELDGLLDDTDDLIRLLAGAREGMAVARKPGGGGGGHPGSKPPGNLDAMLLQAWLSQLPARAFGEATDNPKAGDILYMARIWVPQARELVWGPEDEIIDHATNRERVRDIAPPMPTRQLLPWLRTNAKIAITSMDIRDWARRGKLRAVDTEPQPTYHPHEVLSAWHDTRGQK
ncbi:hypothetical protein [Arthrobacter sp. PsM3]|uniref:hypothetical protein n=1 Tax=Arthrobacter sp. PsM3 TaxID=3030531 RepID=UPI00263A90FD|nr:hypothetical protein [Arthrobacter sp. PsM3]MDN4645374.1 hypothetical protein [Arthrobacter sp. PsM3]